MENKIGLDRGVPRLSTKVSVIDTMGDTSLQRKADALLAPVNVQTPIRTLLCARPVSSQCSEASALSLILAIELSTGFTESGKRRNGWFVEVNEPLLIE